MPQIASAFLVPETTLARRITRAKAKIREAGIPYRLPELADLPRRVAGVLAVLYLIFNEGYLASGPSDPPLRRDLSAEAIRLTRLLHELLPAGGEVTGLLALMVLTEARADARVSDEGELVRLDEQNRQGWNRAMIDEGIELVEQRIAAVAAGGPAPGRYQLLAAINAVHTSAPDASRTDWAQVVALYDRLAGIDPNPLVRLNRAVAVAELDSPQVGLAEVDRLGGVLDGYHAFHATRADLLRRLGRLDQSRAAYERAIELAGNSAEIAYLSRRRDEL